MEYKYETSLKNIKEIKELLDKFYIEFNAKSKAIVYRGKNHLMESIDILKRMEVFEKELKVLENTGFLNLKFISGKENTVSTVNNPKLSAFATHYNNLRIKIDFLQDFLTHTITLGRKHSFRIKLPPTKDFEDLSKISNKLHSAFSYPIIHEDIGGVMEIEKFTNGSILIDVFVGTSSALILVTSLAWAGAVVYKKILEGRMMHKQLEIMNAKKETLEDVKNIQKTALNQLIAAEAMLIIDENYKDKLPEHIGRIKNTVRMLADMMEKGTEIHPSLTTPENVANLFPDPTKLMTIASRVKEIGSGESKTA